MEIKVLWGFEGDPEKVKTQNGHVTAGAVLDLADEEYAHALIGKGLAEAVKPASTKQAKPNENK
ncbi:hypothetical protein J3Q09_17570 [Pseudomonas sp. R4-83]|uniref:hypothetical protein n=1 Tax=unclassified Pseudomonas TaxID=196821 RepID=UPI003DAA38E1